MELRHIRYFMAVAEEMNFTKAAEKLSIAQPPLSRQIKDLEEELGAKLFERTPHSLHLTEEGILFKQYASQMLELENRSKEDIQEISSGLKGRIYIATVEGNAPRLIAGQIALFRKDHPQVTFDIWTGTTDEIINRIHKGLCDLAVIMEPFSDPDTVTVPVYSEPWAAVIPNDDPLAKKASDLVSFDELSDKPLIIPSRASRSSEFRKWMSSPDKPLNIVCRVAHMINVHELTRAGVGIAIFPLSEGAVGDERFVTVKKIDHRDAVASYLLIRDKNRPMSKVAESFFDHFCSNSRVDET